MCIRVQKCGRCSVGGEGDGTFGNLILYSVGRNPYEVVCADIDNDGNLDVISPNLFSNSVSVLMGVGDGTFLDHMDFSTADRPYSVETGDLNQDGLLDLVVPNYFSDSISVLYGKGGGSFADQV